MREAAERRAPHRLTAYAHALASDFHAFYRDCRVVGAEGPGMEEWRLSVCLATQRTIARVSGAARGRGARADVARALDVLEEVQAPAVECLLRLDVEPEQLAAHDQDSDPDQQHPRDAVDDGVVALDEGEGRRCACERDGR